MSIVELTVRQLKITEHIQIREATDQEHVEDIAERMKAGDTLPPIEIVEDGDGSRYLWDGIHRELAAEQAGKKLSARIRKGTIDDAVRFACGANATNGKPRSNETKRRAIETALKRWPDLSDRAVAELCIVSHPLVAKVRSQLEILPVGNGSTPKNPEKRKGRDGKLRQASKPSTQKKTSAKPGKISGGTSFDTKEIEASTSKPRQPKSGMVSLRKEADAALGKLIRTMDKMEMSAPFEQCFEQLAKALKKK